MLCRNRHTVDDLANRLGVTHNAIRAQLQRLERDGYVVQAGSRRGVRRPHVEYELRAEALHLFPRAYEPVLNYVVNALTDRLGANASRNVLLEAARRLLRKHLGDVDGRSPRQRLDGAMRSLNGSNLGIEVRRESGKTVIRSCSCPIASVIAVHPEVCAMFATVLGELLGAGVSESCEKGASARCCFEVTD